MNVLLELNTPDLLNPDCDNLAQLPVENFPVLIFRPLELAPNGISERDNSFFSRIYDGESYVSLAWIG